MDWRRAVAFTGPRSALQCCFCVGAVLISAASHARVCKASELIGAGDPTVSFSGLQKWKQNLQLLVPFLEEPMLDMRSLEQLPRQLPSDPLLLKVCSQCINGVAHRRLYRMMHYVTGLHLFVPSHQHGGGTFLRHHAQ